MLRWKRQRSLSRWLTKKDGLRWIAGKWHRLRLMIGPCSTERRWLTLKPNGDDSPSTGPQGGSMTLATTGP